MSPAPPQGVQRAAARAVRWIEERRAGKGFTATGRHRAHQLADDEHHARREL